MNAKRFHQQKLTVAHSIERSSRWKYKFYDLTDAKSFYKISDERIMMAVHHGLGKDRNKVECAYYNIRKECGRLVIRDPEPTEASIWFDNQILFDEFILKNGLCSAEFTTCKTSNMLPVYNIDDIIPTLWEDFKDFRKGPRKLGNWEVEFVNVKSGKKYKTQGVIAMGQTWKDYFKCIIENIKAMNAGKLSNIKITGVHYNEDNDKTKITS